MADPRHTGRKMIRERAPKTLVSLLPGERPHLRSEHERDVLVDDTGRDMSSFLSKALVFGGDKRSQRPNVSGPMILYPPPCRGFASVEKGRLRLVFSSDPERNKRARCERREALEFTCD